MTAQEFVDSWEKEIYELTHLDYFTYLLINELSSSLENDYFKKLPDDSAMLLHTHEITALSFSIADNLQSFLEKNCFGGCSLGCPNKLSKPFTEEENKKRVEFINMEFDGKAADCNSREECLYYDIMTYVATDTLLDFYNFEIGLHLGEDDPPLKSISSFVAKTIIRFIYKQGREWLTSPNELAFELFQDILEREPGGWEETLLDMPDEEDETEAWKYQYRRVDYIFESFLRENPEYMVRDGYRKIITFFENYLKDYLGLQRMDLFDMDDFDEFLSLILPQQLLTEEEITVRETHTLFYHLFKFADQSLGGQLLSEFSRFIDDKFSEMDRTLDIVRRYQQQNPLIDFLLSDQAGDPDVHEGYFEITQWDATGITLFDIHMKNYYHSVQMPVLSALPITRGDILQAQILVKDDYVRLLFVDMVYPANSRYYLF
ncbi:MAG: hypothetical protein D6677_13685 [Calditrichaeota bacterium]|nr:MAG: hypothetical protein D6677_13685 [Calditrichota bacterium]